MADVAIDIHASEFHGMGAATTRLLERVGRDLGEHPADRVDDIEPDLWLLTTAGPERAEGSMSRFEIFMFVLIIVLVVGCAMFVSL